MKCALSHKWVIPNYRLCYLNELTFNSYLFSFIELLTIIQNINQNIQTLFGE